ncbi:Na+/H+ antiporter subunit C [Pararhodobacter sp.]|uniref:Na+/H+ antiporter subunit C n=1 Tax=Pararhodobacter sp. TaxID=2127056 RepID=UPI002FDED3E4
MELLVAAAIGIMTTGGVYLMLRLRTFPVVLGLSLLTYAVNTFLFASGRLVLNAPPVLIEPAPYADPLPQALVLTAIVIAFGMTALAVILALGAYLNSGTDALDIEKPGTRIKTDR